jgi:hypothetical protein
MSEKMPEVFQEVGVSPGQEETVEFWRDMDKANSGAPGRELRFSLDWLVRQISERLRSNRDYVVVIDGPKGEGKSTLAYHLAKRLSEGFSFEQNYVFRYSYKEIESKIYGLPRYSPIVIDEGLKIFYKLDWTSQIQNNLIKLFSTSRKHNKVVFLCLPYFSELRTSFRQNLVNMWIHVVERGEAVLFMPDANPFVTDKWAFADCDKIYRAKAAKIRVSRKEKKYFVFRQLSVYRGEFSFSPMLEADEKSYLDLVRLSELDESGGSDENARVLRYRLAWGNLSAKVVEGKLAPLTKIAEWSKMPYSTLNDLLRELGARPIDKKIVEEIAPKESTFSKEIEAKITNGT